MKAKQEELVEGRFVRIIRIIRISDIAAELFYVRLLDTNPKLRMLLKGDLREQRRNLLQMIEKAVEGPDNLGALNEQSPQLDSLACILPSNSIANEQLTLIDGAGERLARLMQNQQGFSNGSSLADV